MKKILAAAIVFTLLAAACKTGQNTDQTETQAKKIDARQYCKDNADKIVQLCTEWEPNADFLYTHYAFIDLDSDGVEELYISEDDSPYGWLLCFGADSAEVITSSDPNFHVSYIGNLVQMSGMFPSLSAFTKYYEINGSKVTGPDFMGRGQMDPITGQLIIKYYYLNDENTLYPLDKTKSFSDKVNKLRLMGNSWRDFKGIELEEDPFGVFIGKMPAEDADPAEAEQ